MLPTQLVSLKKQLKGVHRTSLSTIGWSRKVEVDIKRTSSHNDGNPQVCWIAVFEKMHQKLTFKGAHVNVFHQETFR